MSATAVTSISKGSTKFYEASVGKKVVHAVTGCILVLFVLGHLVGNLQVFMGAEQINEYARLLRNLHGMIWVVRAVVLVAFVWHIIIGIQLWLTNRAARPVDYQKRKWVKASFASRTMIITGPLVLAFVIYHLLDLTFGVVHPNFNHNLNVYANIVSDFQRAPIAIIYIVAMIVLGYHMSHGIWSMFQSVGLNGPRWTPFIQKCAWVIAVLFVIGMSSIPVSVMIGLIH